MAQYFGKTVAQDRYVGLAVRALFQIKRCRAIAVMVWCCIFAELSNPTAGEACRLLYVDAQM